MLLTEYNEVEIMEIFKEEGWTEGWEKGWKEGIQEGERKFGKLMYALISAGRTDDALRASMDGVYREALYGEYGIA